MRAYHDVPEGNFISKDDQRCGDHDNAFGGICNLKQGRAKVDEQ